MPHPYFEQLPNPDMADALSEMLEPGGYKTFSRDSAHNGDFPPEPAYLTSVTATILSNDGGSFQRVTMHGVSGDRHKVAYKDAVQSYEKDTFVSMKDVKQQFESHAEHIPGLEEAHPRFGRLGQWAINAANRDGRRVVAAHVIFKNAQRNALHTGVIYPTVIKNEFPLVFRNYISDLAGRELPDEFKALSPFIETMMKNTEEAHKIAALPAVAVLPPLASFRQALKAAR